MIIENAEAFNIYSYCSSQLLLGPDGQSYAIKMEAIEIAMLRFGAAKPSEIMSKILSLSEQIINFQNEKRKSEAAKQKGKKK